MVIAIYVLHIIVCLALILIVLLQTGKGSDVGAAFGGASQTMFGAGGRQTALSKLTAGAAIIFMCTCLFLAWMSSQRYSTGLMDNLKGKQEQTKTALPKAPATPGMPGAAPATGAIPPGAGMPAGGGGTREVELPAPGGAPAEGQPEQAPAGMPAPQGNAAPAAPAPEQPQQP